jgi:hypothetical protein
MPVIINGNRIVPAPTVTINKEFVTTRGDGVVTSNYTFTLNGTLVTNKGNPQSSGATPTVAFTGDPAYSTFTPDDDPINTDLQPSGYLTSIMEKQKALTNVMTSGDNDVTFLEIYGFNAEQGWRGFCNIQSIDFDDATRWTNTCGYTINLQCPYVLDDPVPTGYLVENPQESWNVSEDTDYSASSGNIYEQNKSFTVTHSASAQGKRAFGEDGAFFSGLSPFQQASGYVHNVIGVGLDSSSSPETFLNIKNLLGTNFVVVNKIFSEEINELEGTYNVNEEFTVFKSGQLAKESVEISVDKDTSAFTKVTINGTVNGLITTDPSGVTVDSWSNASGYFDALSTGVIYSRANDFAAPNTNLNTTPLSSNIGRNFTQGSITYSYNYDNRPSNAFSDALTEDIQISDTYPGQNINEVAVIGREQPIIQYLNSRSSYKRSLQINLQMDIDPDTDEPFRPKDSELVDIFDLYKPNGPYVYYSSPQESWNPKTGAYTYSIEWTFKGPGAGTGFSRRQ